MIKQYNKQIELLDSIEKRSGKLKSKLIRESQHLAKRAIANGPLGKLEASPELVSEIMDYMGYSMTRVLKSPIFKQPGLSLSFKTDLAEAANSFNIHIGTASKRVRHIVKKNATNHLLRLRKVINEELARISSRGFTTRGGIRAMNKRLKEFGVSPTNSGYVETLVRTHAQMAFGAAHWLRYRDDPNVWGYQYLTKRDLAVRDSHRVGEGIIRKKHDILWTHFWPPNGWRCRCQVVALFEKHRQTRVPPGIAADEGFGFNPGIDFFG